MGWDTNTKNIVSAISVSTTELQLILTTYGRRSARYGAIVMGKAPFLNQHKAGPKAPLWTATDVILWFIFIMLFRNIFPLLALVSLVASSPSASRPIPPKEDMRLVKISEDDAGVWVTEEEKFTKFISKHINFVDVTETWVRTLNP
jgi:hypothetical protein